MPRFEPAGGSTPVWLDHTDYTARLLAGGQPPWLDALACAAWLKKGQGLLRPDVVRFPATDLIEAWLQAHAELVSALGEKSRASYPVKRLLADEPLRQHLADVLQALRGSVAQVPIALAIETPGALVQRANRHAGRDAEAPDEDLVDTAAMYLADALRELASLAPDCIDIVLLESDGDDAELSLCQPVFNVAEHQRWQVAARCTGRLSHAAVDIAVAPAPTTGTRGIWIDEATWSRDDAPPSAGGDFWFARVPEDADPERVLTRLEGLRQAPAQ